MKSLIPLAAILGVLIIGGLWYVNAGNGMIALEERVNTASSQVENVYQRRADLIPNLVATVKGYAKHEADVLEAVTQARAQVGQVKVNGLKTAEDMQKFDQSQGQLSSALSRLLVVSEKYPELKNDMNYLHEFSSRSNNADLAGRIIFNEEGIEVFNFGKHKDKVVEEIFKKEPSYYNWMMDGDFPLHTKKVITAIKLRGAFKS